MRTALSDRWTRAGYLLLGLVLVVWAVLVTARHGWAGDMRLHLGTVHGLVRHPLSAADPLVGSVRGSPYYSPYMVVLAAVSKVTGITPLGVLELAGPVNLVFWLWALRRFCRHLGPGPLLPALVVVFTLLLWGLRPRDWSGFLSLYSLSWTMAYPSVFGTALMFLAWDVQLRRRDRPADLALTVTLGLLMALLVLIHPFTALNALLGLLAFTRRSMLASWQLWAGAALALVLALLWPWSDVTELFGAAGGLSGIHLDLILDLGRSWGFAHYGLALVGLPALVTGLSRPLGRELIILFAAAVAVIGLGAAAGAYGLARMIPVAVLPLHLALASYLATAKPWHRRAAAWRGRVCVLVTVVACAAGLFGNAGGLLRAWWLPVSAATLAAWDTRNPQTRYDALLPEIKPGAVVLVERTWVGRMVNSRGAYSVVPAWPYPFVDEAARRRDSAAFFGARTGVARRMAIADRYRVTCVLARRRSAVLRPGALVGFRVRTPVPHHAVRLACR
ncbi:MAG: hypothetical protein ABIS86_12440 [Streptosporangiaceae bacterium]